jgi:hypothetical protein
VRTVEWHWIFDYVCLGLDLLGKIDLRLCIFIFAEKAIRLYPLVKSILPNLPLSSSPPILSKVLVCREPLMSSGRRVVILRTSNAKQA